MNRPNTVSDWRIYASWFMSGAIFGLTIAQFMVKDEALSWAILIWTFSILALNLLLLLFVIVRCRR